jgi:CRP/FNR family transcriptional regulator, cyclic AMP receptor protein
LLDRLTKTIRALTTRVYEFSTLAVNNRIQAELLGLASLGPKEGKNARIVPAPTHVEIASRVSTHREAVTRELNRLSRIGIIERRGGTLLVKDTDRLSEMVQCPPPGQAKQEPLGRNRASRDSQGCGLQAPQYGGTP